MDAEIRHGAHGGLGLVKEPGVLARGDAPGLGAAVTEGGAEGDDLADLAVGNHLLCQLVRVGEALVLADHQALALLFGNPHHLFAVGEGDGHGLLAENMLAGLQGLDAELGVRVVGSADGNRVDFGIGKEFIRRVVDLAAVFGSHVFSAGSGRVKEADELAAGVFIVLGDVTDLGNFAAAKDTDFNHESIPPIHQTIRSLR